MNDSPIKCIVIDDEPLAISLIEAYISKIPFLDCLGGFTNAARARTAIEGQDIELVFSDIEMPGISGIELAQILPENCAVVFITAYENYALDGFKVNAIDYLLKPVSFKDFQRSCNKIKRYLRPSVSVRDDGKIIKVRADRKDIFILLSDITYVEALKDYMLIHTNAGNIVTNCTLKHLSAQLPENDFIRIHRSYIVNRQKISAIGAGFVMVGNKELPVSGSYRSEVKALALSRG